MTKVSKFYSKELLVFREMPNRVNFLNETNNTYGRLTVLGYAGQYELSGSSEWYCECICGNITKVGGRTLRNGQSKSCGCYQADIAAKTHTVHGHGKRGNHSFTHCSWSMMMDRCRNTKNKDYPNYGGRGIIVCERWLKFENFLEDMGEKPMRGMSIERIDNMGNYEPNNCKWATHYEQSRNKRSSVILSFNGMTMIAEDWAKLMNISAGAIRHRISSGWAIEDILTKPSIRPKK